MKENKQENPNIFYKILEFMTEGLEAKICRFSGLSFHFLTPDK